MDNENTSVLLSFMQTYFTPEKLDAYVDVLDFINAVNEDYTDNLETYFLSISENYEVSEILDHIDNMLVEQFTVMFKNIGVNLQQEYPLNVLALKSIYENMISVENNEQIDVALSILESHDDYRLAFYELMNVVGSLMIDEETYNQHILDVSEATIEKLRQWYLKEKILQDTDNQPVDQYIKKVKHFITALRDDKLYMVDKIKEGIHIGLPLKSYLDLFFNDLLELDFKESAYNLYIMALISNDGCHNPIQALDGILMNYIKDLSILDALMYALQQLQLNIGEK